MGAKRLLMNSDNIFLNKFGCKLFISKKNGKTSSTLIEQKKKKIFHNMIVGNGKNFVFQKLICKPNKKTTKKMKKKFYKFNILQFKNYK